MPYFDIVSSITVFLAVALLVWGVGTLMGRRLAAQYDRSLAYIHENLGYLFIKDVTPKQVAGLTVAGAVVVAVIIWLFSGSMILSLAGLAATLFTPRFVFQYLHQKRRTRIEEGLPAALDQMVSSAKAGLNLAQLLEDVEKKGAPPVSDEFGLIMQEYRLGHDLETTITAANKRLGSRMFTLFASALLINRQKGGNLPEALETMSTSFKEIDRLEKKVVTASSEGRKGVRVISFMPVFIFLFVSMAQPELIDTLTSNIVGWILIIIAVVLYVVALLWLRKILAVDI